MEEGRYIAKVTLNDKLAGREVTASSVFNLKK
jgi:homoserine dehydrogenase